MRLYAATLMTSLETSGVQVSVLRLSDVDWLRCLDAPSTAPAWPGRPYSIPTMKENKSCDSKSDVKNVELKVTIWLYFV